jgi:hypothetical protein
MACSLGGIGFFRGMADRIKQPPKIVKIILAPETQIVTILQMAVTMSQLDKRSRPHETVALRIAMAKRGLTCKALASLLGKDRFSPRRVSNVLAGNDRTWPIRAAINRALREKIFNRTGTPKQNTP